jgi:hypothetical protein
MSRSRAKGTAGESAVVNWLLAKGYRYAERRALQGSRDRGDIAGLPGVVIEVKACKQWEPAAWIGELETEITNDGTPDAVGVIIIKRRGTTDVGKWYALMTADQWLTLLQQAGWAPNGVIAEAGTDA